MFNRQDILWKYINAAPSVPINADEVTRLRAIRSPEEARRMDDPRVVTPCLRAAKQELSEVCMSRALVLDFGNIRLSRVHAQRARELRAMVGALMEAAVVCEKQMAADLEAIRAAMESA